MGVFQNSVRRNLEEGEGPFKGAFYPPGVSILQIWGLGCWVRGVDNSLRDGQLSEIIGSLKSEGIYLGWGVIWQLESYYVLLWQYIVYFPLLKGCWCFLFSLWEAIELEKTGEKALLKI